MKNPLKVLRGTGDTEGNLATFVLRGLARLAERCETLEPAVRERLGDLASIPSGAGDGLLASVTRYLGCPGAVDAPLADVARHFTLMPIETLGVSLAVAAEQDLFVGHLLSHLQQPLALTRPTIGLVAQAFSPQDVHRAIHHLGQGNAVRCGLLQLHGDDRPLPERQLRVPLPTVLQLQGMDGSWPGAMPLDQKDLFPALTDATRARAAAFAQRMRADARGSVLVVRCGDALEARTVAQCVCMQQDRSGILVQNEQPLAGLAPWLQLNGAIPVFSQWLSPGERRPVPAVPGYRGAQILLTGPEGEFEDDTRPVYDWRIVAPDAAERAEIWRSALGDGPLAERLASEHRHSAGRIVALAAKAREAAAGRAAAPGAAAVSYDDVRSVARRGESVGLGALAELVADDVHDRALVTSDSLQRELESLVVRCRLRERFPDSLGPSLQARYRPSVRALFVGLSGTGKTLAVAWLATRLGIPLFRVDLAAITSKYIGETEKNLSQLLARAEQSEVILLFDEADSLFGKRTDINDSNDRFANAQTNYLLQRMESYDGITVLTSNGRSRFDDAFSRRFDAIITFPLPGAQQRRELWLAHLGAEHDVGPAQLNQLAAVAELSGGQIRNAVLQGAVAAAEEGVAISHRHLLLGVTVEYRKLSRQLPNELKLA